MKLRRELERRCSRKCKDSKALNVIKGVTIEMKILALLKEDTSIAANEMVADWDKLKIQIAIWSK